MQWTDMSTHCVLCLNRSGSFRNKTRLVTHCLYLQHATIMPVH